VTRPEVIEKLFANILPRLKERPGGYTRIIHKGMRLGDAAPMVIIEIVD
jgi:large subunit ribosomal protein L17